MGLAANPALRDMVGVGPPSYGGWQEGDTLSDFVPFVMARLQASRPADYADHRLDCTGLSLLHQRLRAALEDVAMGFAPDSAIHRVVFRKRGRPSQVRATAYS